MMRRLARLALLMFFALAPAAGAGERIAGAFGVRFGDHFPPEAARETASLNERIPLYQFTPQEPHPLFTRYYVEITPQSQRVYSIWGYGHGHGFEACRAGRAELLAELEPRYGSVRRSFLFPSAGERRIVQRDREILIECTGHDASRLLVRFTDRRLQETAERERTASP